MSKIILKYGIIGGLVSIISCVLIYVMGLTIFVSVIGMLFIVIYILLGIFAVKEHRKNNDGIIDFGKAFLVPLLSYIILFLISTAFSFILFNQIDPSWTQTQKEKLKEKIENIEALPQEAKDKQLEKIDKRMDNMYSGKKILISFAGNIGFFAIVSLIIAASVRKNLNEIPII